MDALAELADRWRNEADVLRRRGAGAQAKVLASCAEELEAASAARKLEPVTLEEAERIGGYSYSHLQHLVADGTIENVGEKGSPRIRRCDVPLKPGYGRPAEPRTKGDLFKEEVLTLGKRDA